MCELLHCLHVCLVVIKGYLSIGRQPALLGTCLPVGNFILTWKVVLYVQFQDSYTEISNRYRHVLEYS